MKRALLTIITFAASLVATFAQTTEWKELTVGGLKRKFIIHVPANLPENAPLLITFHGFNQSPDYQMNTTDWNDFSDKYKFIVIYPEYDGGFWDTGGDKDVNFTKSIIKWANSNYKINKNRVYASGFSLGAMMTYHLIGKMAKEIAAFAPVSGVRFDNKKPTGARHVPLIHHHGSNDDVFQFGGDLGHMAGGYPAITDYVTMWAEWNGCDMQNKKSTTVQGDTHITWVNAKEGIETRYNIINGAGHWHAKSGGTYTTQEIWDFVSRYSLDGDCSMFVTKIMPANGKTGLTNTQTFTLGFTETMDLEDITATLTGEGQTIEMVKATTQAKAKSLKLQFPEGTELNGGEYSLTINGVKTANGGVKGHITYKYGFEKTASTSVGSMPAEAKADEAYTISGMKADASTKGILIAGGKKIYKQ